MHTIDRQQAVSALTDTNDTSYAYGGAQWSTFAFEYWSNPDNRDEGFITWVAGSPVFRVDNHVFTGDPSVNISNRLIPEEPMVCISQLRPNDDNAYVELLLRFS